MIAEEMLRRGQFAQENYGIASGGERAIANFIDNLDEADIENLLYYFDEQEIVGLFNLYLEERKSYAK